MRDSGVLALTRILWAHWLTCLSRKLFICIIEIANELWLAGTYAEASIWWGRVSVFFQQIFNDASKICGGGLSKLNARDVFMIKIHSKKFAPFFVNCYFRVLAWMTMMRKIRPLIFYKIANNRYLKSILLKLSYELNKFYGNIRVCSSILVRSRDGLRASGPRAEAGRAGPGPTKGSNGRGRVLNKNWPNCHL